MEFQDFLLLGFYKCYGFSGILEKNTSRDIEIGVAYCGPSYQFGQKLLKFSISLIMVLVLAGVLNFYEDLNVNRFW